MIHYLNVLKSALTTYLSLFCVFKDKECLYGIYVLVCLSYLQVNKDNQIGTYMSLYYYTILT
jgi:hypothetical protein